MSLEQDGKSRYTLSDIARELGVNKATVSKAISGKGNLSADTRARILTFIEKCGYQPNAVAQSLARSRTYNIGLMMPGDVGVFDMAFFRDCLQGVCKTASGSGYDVLITMDDEHPQEQIARLIANRKIDGVITMRSLVDSQIVDFLKQRQVPFIVIGAAADPEVRSVDNDNRGACRDLTSLLITRGVRKMALLGGDESYLVTHSRLQGFLDACRQWGLKEEEQLIYLNTLRGSRLAVAVDDALSRKAQCIVCMDDYICNMALVRLRSAGVGIPADIQIVSFYDNILLEGNDPPITSLRFNAARLGRIACEQLIDLMEGRAAGAAALPGYKIMLRDSTK